MRRLTWAIIFLLLVLSRAALADEADPKVGAGGVCGAGPVRNVAICDDTGPGSEASRIVQPITIGPNGRTAGAAVKTGTSTKVYVPYNRLSTGPDGKPCASTGYVEKDTTPPDERLLIDPNPRETNIPITGSDLRILETYPPCPAQPRAPGDPAVLETPGMMAARYWEQVSLPEPKPTIAPGRAITGKLAFLETHGELAHTYTNATAFGPLTIKAMGTYTVDWGDGTTTGPHALEGAPWPDGAITHEYLRVGTYRVHVTERWTADWSLDGQSGTLRTLQSEGTISNFPVEQIQAVIGK